MDDYPTRADEVREAWKQKEKPVMPVERLRALEKKWREMANDRANAEWVTLVNCANELRDLIAELGQEVGAVAWPSERVSIADPHDPGYRIVGFKISESHPWHGKYGLSEPLNALDRAISNSPAHTSEARDSALGDLYDAASKGFHISETCGPDKKYWHVSKFQTLAELNAYEDAWCTAMARVRDERVKA